MQAEELEISDRFCGPPNSGNGGYVCGLTARGLAGAVAVRLKRPPPLNTPLRREWTSEAACLLHGTTVVAEARSAELALAPPGPTGLDAARRAAESYPGFAAHPFPRCFVCGPDRVPGDGLRIFAGPLPGEGLHAAPWVPDRSLARADGRVAPEFIWAALDCPGGFAVLPLPGNATIVLGELGAKIIREAVVGEPVVVSSWSIGSAGRRHTAGSAIHDADGRLVAIARSTWIEVPVSQWTPRS